MGGLYVAGKNTQQRFQSGWTPSYLTGYTAAPDRKFGAFRRQLNAPTSRLARVNLATTAPSGKVAPTQYFMAGDKRCPYTVKAREQNAPNVVALECGNSVADNDKDHPVCAQNRAAGRGVPSYYKQVSADAYEFVHSGFDANLAFLKT